MILWTKGPMKTYIVTWTYTVEAENANEALGFAETAMDGGYITAEVEEVDSLDSL